MNINTHETVYITPPEQWVCDFCHGGPVICRFPCPDFTIDTLATDYAAIAMDSQTWTGDWFACPRCRVLVLARDLDGLVRYVLARNPALRHLPRDFAEILSRTTYAAFFVRYKAPVPTNTRGVAVKPGMAMPLPPNRAARRHPKT